MAGKLSTIKSAAAITMICLLSGCYSGAHIEQASVADMPASRAVEARRFRVLDVIDGDTFRIRYDGQRVRVRLALVDCPERKEQGGPEATEFARKMIEGKYVTIDFTDPDGRHRDHYGRLLCSVWVLDNTGQEIDLEAELVSHGLATWRDKH